MCGMMLSWHGNAFRITALLWWETNGPLVDSSPNWVSISGTLSFIVVASLTTCWTNRRGAGDLGHFYATLLYWHFVRVIIHLSLPGGIIRPFTICTADKCMLSRRTWTKWYSRQLLHDYVIKWKHFPRYWPFLLGIHRSTVNSLHKGQWRGALMFSLIYAWTNDWVNNRDAIGLIMTSL